MAMVYLSVPPFAWLVIAWALLKHIECGRAQIVAGLPSSTTSSLIARQTLSKSYVRANASFGYETPLFNISTVSAAIGA